MPITAWKHTERNRDRDRDRDRKKSIFYDVVSFGDSSTDATS